MFCRFWKKKNIKKRELQPELIIEERIITNYLTDGLLVFDKQGKLFLINPQAEKFFEAKKEEILKKSILELNRYPNFQPLISLLGGGIEELSKKELQIKENFILEVTSISMMAGQEKIGSLVILHDVTKEKLVDRMKSEFVTLAAHQLRTPTSAVKWSMRMLLDEELGKLNDEQKKRIEETYRTNDKVIKLINDLLNVAQIEAGKYLAKITLSDIEEIIKEVIEEYQKEIERKQFKFEFKKPKEKLPKIMIDVEKIKIAIKNILDNAIRYTLPGGKISIFLKGFEKEIEIQIKDTGLGIPQNQQDKVFTMFFRAANVMKLETEGSGLGLYLSKNIIEAHGGTIWFKSKEGEGSIFYFTIPIKERFGEFLTKEFY